MSQDVVLELESGKLFMSDLAKPFDPDDNKLHLQMDGEGPRTVNLSKVSSVRLKNIPPDIEQLREKADLEEIHTMGGDHFFARTIREKEFDAGFYAFLLDKATPYKLIFITKNGCKVRQQYRPIGEILEEDGFISPYDLADVLDKQNQLKQKKIGTIISDEGGVDRNEIESTLRHAGTDLKKMMRSKIGDILIAEGVVTQEQVDEALIRQKHYKQKQIGTLLVENNIISEEQLMKAIATKFNLNFVDLSEVTSDPKVVNILPNEIVNRLQVFPIQIENDRLVVATFKPNDHTISDILRFHTGRNIKLVVATARQISKAIETQYGMGRDDLKDLIDEIPEAELGDMELDESPEEMMAEGNSQVINIVNKLLIDAYQKQASDIHLEPGFGKYPLQVRYRIDGVCKTVLYLPFVFKSAVVARLKIMSNLDIAEKRRPQSGKLILGYKKKKLEFRLEITPTVGQNEDVVLRLLGASKPIPIDQMGFSDFNLKLFQKNLKKPHGLVLCVGPTGSGKTTTLHSGLNYINSPELKILTAEDPVEITQQGLRQVQINKKIGLTFGEALRSFLRADPDVIMVGEIRDGETAKIAIEASLTGHLVMSTLHTNSAPETLVRLLEMGVDPFSFSDAIQCVIGQRLAARLCDNCKQKHQASDKEFEELRDYYGDDWYQANQMPDKDRLSMMDPKGCPACGHTGFRGRMAIHEVLNLTPKIRRALRNPLADQDLKEMAVSEGMRTLMMDGIAKVINGQTTLAQLLRVVA